MGFTFSSAVCPPACPPIHRCPPPSASGHRQHSVRDAASQWGTDKGECKGGGGGEGLRQVVGCAFGRY